ncbi:MAG: hypothetical protein JSU94_10400 [Phycisphaerales bacterium]|nr:MAG: hypothetical protein JSU94_10400 [Phycisphaerales bacterium]
MKIQRPGILCCLLLSGIASLTLLLVAYAVPPATAIPDSEIAAVYGGCGPCIYDVDQACPDSTGTKCEDQSYEQCDGLYRESCRQHIKFCSDVDFLPCQEYQKKCEGDRNYYKCVPWDHPVHGPICYADLICTMSCGTTETKKWCY